MSSRSRHYSARNRDRSLQNAVLVCFVLFVALAIIYGAEMAWDRHYEKIRMQYEKRKMEREMYGAPRIRGLR